MNVFFVAHTHLNLNDSLNVGTIPLTSPIVPVPADLQSAGLETGICNPLLCAINSHFLIVLPAKVILFI
jgi:hypothetical protein